MRLSFVSMISENLKMDNKFTFTETGFNGLYLIGIKPLKDERGKFARTYCKKDFAQIGFDKEFVQINFSFNFKKGTLRGMHYQVPPYEETKLIRCVSGKVFDVAVDLRKDSPTYMKWFGTELSKVNMEMILIPEGFAHGFITLEDDAELIYHHTQYFNKDADRGIRYDDPAIGISWPEEVNVISGKDKSYELLNL